MDFLYTYFEFNNSKNDSGDDDAPRGYTYL